jgi:hypothetical protein
MRKQRAKDSFFLHLCQVPVRLSTVQRRLFGLIAAMGAAVLTMLPRCRVQSIWGSKPCYAHFCFQHLLWW